MQLAEESLGQSLVTTESLNISRGGVHCESDEYLAPLSRVALTVVLPAFRAGVAPRVLRTEGIVVRSEALAPVRGRKRWQLACCFTSLDTDARALLDAFVAWRAAGGRTAARRLAAAAGAKAATTAAPKKAVRKAVKKAARKVAKKPAATAVKKAVKKAVRTAAGPKPRGGR
jgi:hypothetical protein